MSEGYDSVGGGSKGERETAAMAAATRHKFGWSQIRARATIDRMYTKKYKKQTLEQPAYNVGDTII